MRSELTFLAGLLAMPYAWADLQAKPHTGVAGIDFESQVGYDVGYNDNVTWQRYGGNEIGSAYQGVKPIFKAIGERYEDRYLLMYSGDYRRYASDSADNRDNHFFMFNGKWRFGSMHGLSLDLDETFDYEERGTAIPPRGFSPSSLKSLALISPSPRASLTVNCAIATGRRKGAVKQKLR